MMTTLVVIRNSGPGNVEVTQQLSPVRVLVDTVTPGVELSAYLHSGIELKVRELPPSD